MSKDLGKILYWSGNLEPHREGISKELFMLHNHFADSFIIGTSPGGGFMYSRDGRYFGMPTKLLPSVRYWARFLEKAFDFSHIIHGINNYHVLKALNNKPVILTAVSIDGVLSMEHYKNISRIVVECQRDKERLVNHGFSSGSIDVIYPGTTLPAFDNASPPSNGFRILFASSPFSLEYMESRGVRLLLETARMRTDIEFVLLWRTGGNTLNLLKQWIKELSLLNVTVINNDIDDIKRMYVSTHATILPFTTDSFTKSSPNSAVESLSAGRPVLISNKVGIADIVQEESCGVVFMPDTESLINAIEKLQSNYVGYQQNALRCAYKYFSRAVFLNSYNELYRKICSDSISGRGL